MMGLVSGRRRATSNASESPAILFLPGLYSAQSFRQPSAASLKLEARETVCYGGRFDPLAKQRNLSKTTLSSWNPTREMLRPGADLSKVVLPTFILEPRSMLERITNFMCHPEMLLPIPTIDDPVQRFVAVVKFYLSGWHIRPPGVKKPLNPILGEIFTCSWEFPDNTRAYYIAEQTSHHPPKSSYFYMVPGHNIRVDGTLKPRSKFLGNSAASMMEGTAILSILNRGKDPVKGERYTLTQPNMYARGILFGKMKYELGDHSYVRCPETGLSADIEFKTKGWVSGTYNAIGGTIKNDRTGEVLYELSGLWSEEMFIKNVKTGHKEMFFNALKSKPSPPICRPLEEQDERESQRLWAKTARAVKKRNHELATEEKTKVEELQREEAAKRANDGVEWRPRLFRRVKGGPGGPEEGEEELEWIINAQIDGATPEKQAAQILAIYPIVKGQKFNQKNAIPHRPSLSDPGAGPKEHHTEEEHLINFDDEGSAPPQPSATAQSSATGNRAKDGPLIDFHNDIKRDLPANVKRTDSTESDDDFVDAQG
ncbi:7e231aec-67c7-4089-9e36-ff27684d6f2a [Thermothielavioides terrestris]|uniref:7e231aec-67c7-4089-9e36-ff27684d6f2a n=1 Tax=Thermothielavioides terrestris TaxID=2587410 RepID=A0A3S4BEK5_9PEZI|nr:7e231aec-67c7-4089-9e36-ff27684d6f2a [Thermothielavioides terrestris]